MLPQIQVDTATLKRLIQVDIDKLNKAIAMLEDRIRLIVEFDPDKLSTELHGLAPLLEWVQEYLRTYAVEMGQLRLFMLTQITELKNRLASVDAGIIIPPANPGTFN